MNMLSGMGGQQPQQPQQPQQRINVDVESLPDIVCDCGCGIWESGLKFKKLSALVSPTGQEQIIPMQVAYCKSCGKEMIEVLKEQELRKELARKQ